jgi:hypothetical protein
LFILKLFDYILLALSVVFLIIGIDQTVKGIPLQFTYWSFMVSGGCLIGLNLRKVQKKNLNSPERKLSKAKQKLPEKPQQLKRK